MTVDSHSLIDPGLAEILLGFPPMPLLSDEVLLGVRPFAGPGYSAVEAIVEALGLQHEERSIPGADGNSITVSIFRPARKLEDAPVVISIHGGGMVMGDRFGGLSVYTFLEWAARLGLVVVCPEYRLAPDFLAPAGAEDCYSTLKWVAHNAAEFGASADRIVIAGVSGGGGLAAATALLARDRSGPRAVAQLLICPQLDDRNVTASSEQFSNELGTGGSWPRENNLFAWNAVLGTGHETRDDVSAYSAPARATDLSNLPTSFIDAGSAEVFRDEAVAYASALWAAGTQAELHIWAGGFHGFELASPDSAISVAARAARESWLRRTLGI
jgi:acetyl esterase/lipase